MQHNEQQRYAAYPQLQSEGEIIHLNDVGDETATQPHSIQITTSHIFETISDIDLLRFIEYNNNEDKKPRAI